MTWLTRVFQSRVVGVIAALLLFVHTLLIAISALPAAYIVLTPTMQEYVSSASWMALTIEAVIVIAVLLAFRSLRRGREDSSALGVVTILGIISFLLALVSYLPCSGEQAPFYTSVSRALLVFLGSIDEPFGIEPGCAHTIPLALQAARLGAIVAVGVGVVSALAVLFRTQLDRFLVRIARKLVIVIGYDSESFALLNKISAACTRRQRIAMYIDGDLPEVVPPRTSIVRTALTNSISPLLRRLRGEISAIYLLSPDSSQVLQHLRECKEQLAARNRAPVVILRIDNIWQAEHWRRELISADETWLVDVLSSYEQTARVLADRILAANIDRLLIVGTSSLRLALASELARCRRESLVTRHETPSVPELIFVGDDAETAHRQHLMLQSRFGNIDQVRSDSRSASDAVFRQLLANAQQPAVVQTDSTGVAASALATTNPDWTIFAFDPAATGVSGEPVMGRLYPFNVGLVPDDTAELHMWERAARIIHANYLYDYGYGAGPAAVDWDELDPFYRDSNLRLVTNTLVSASAIGRSWGAFAGPSMGFDHGVPEGDLTKMAEREHAQWCTHYTDNGWQYGSIREDSKKRHNRLVGWENLDVASQERTRQGVSDALGVLAALGYRSIDPTALDNGGGMEFKRKGEVEAELLDVAWEWKAENGASMRAEPGDWRVRDGSGRSWSVKPEEFAATYANIEGNRWSRMGTVRARLGVVGEKIATLEGPIVVTSHSWVVQSDSGARWIVPADQFEKNYERTPTPY